MDVHAKYVCIFRPVIHGKNVFKGFCYINLYKKLSP